MRSQRKARVFISKTAHGKYFMTEEPLALEVLKNYRNGQYGYGGKR